MWIQYFWSHITAACISPSTAQNLLIFGDINLTYACIIAKYHKHLMRLIPNQSLLCHSLAGFGFALRKNIRLIHAWRILLSIIVLLKKFIPSYPFENCLWLINFLNSIISSSIYISSYHIYHFSSMYWPYPNILPLSAHIPFYNPHTHPNILLSSNRYNIIYKWHVMPLILSYHNL